MKTLYLLLVLFISTSFYAQESMESPYLQVLTEDASIPLKETKTSVQITGTIAYVHITQVYHNTGKTPIEAKYVFPLSLRAAVHKMDMTIGDKTIHAKIFEKVEAQRVYDNAIKSGKRAAKLDQERPNVFQMNVGNILPNDEITIDIHYTEMLLPIDGNYQFVYPAVVGPRYVGEKGSEPVFNQAYTKKGIADTFKFDIDVTLNAGNILQKVFSTTHKININYPETQTAEVFLSKSNVNPSNRDFILNYSLRGNKIQSGLMLYQGEEENFFAYIMEPPATVKNKDIPPREYVFILDVSGSMTGYPLDISKKLLRDLLSDLRTEDSFNILLFAGDSMVFNDKPVRATNENLKKAMQFLSGSFNGGSTNLLNALKTAYRLPRVNKNNSRSMIIVTDGYVNVEKEAFSIIKDNLNQANVFTFGIGSSVNRYLLEGMAKVSNSQSFIVSGDEEEAYAVAEKFRKYIATPILTQISFKTKGFETYDVEPSSISDVFSNRPILVFGKWRGYPSGEIQITGKTGQGNFSQKFNVSNASLSRKNEAIKYLWARKKIELLDDYNESSSSSKDEVIKLGIKYNLVTQYTSFVAVEDKVVNKDGNLKTVSQPLPMPKNVSNAAVGAEASITGKTLVTKTYSVSILDKLTTRSETRTIKMWLKINHADLIKKLLKQYTSIKIKFDANGKIKVVFVFENGQWKKDEALKTLFINNSGNSSVKKKLTVVIK